MTPEFARQLTELSHETRRQIGALIDRKGYVEYVVVGDARRIELPDLKRTRVAADRFRGLRCVHTHLRGEELTQDDLTDLALLRLDLMVALDVDERTGLPVCARGALAAVRHVARTDEAADGRSNAGARMRALLRSRLFLEPQIPSQLDVDFLALINSLEEEMARNRRTRPPRRSARTHDPRRRDNRLGLRSRRVMAELGELATSAGVVVLDQIIQRRSAIDPRTVLGKGKLEELLVRALQLGADLIVFDRESATGASALAVGSDRSQSH